MSKEAYDKLAKLFYDPKTGFISAGKLIQKAVDNGIYLPESAIRKWYDEQEVNQIYHEKPASKESSMYYKVVAPHIGYLEADLIDMRNLARYNGGYKWILNIIDLRSRYVWAKAVKSKKAADVSPFVEQVIESVSKRYPANIITLTTDDGGEFKGQLREFLDRYNIDHYIANPNDNTKRRTAHIESWNRTLLRMLFKALHSANNWKWIDILPAIIYNHNHTINKQISDRNHQLTPYDVYIRGRKSYEKKVPFVDNLAIGDYVRIRAIESDSTEAAFKKKTREQKYSQTVYRIIGRDGVRYMLTKPETLLILNKSYLPRQLLKVSGQMK